MSSIILRFSSVAGTTKHALIHTYKTEKELNEYMDRHHGTEKFLIYMGAALCWNMIAHWQEEGHSE